MINTDNMVEVHQDSLGDTSIVYNNLIFPFSFKTAIEIISIIRDQWSNGFQLFSGDTIENYPDLFPEGLSEDTFRMGFTQEELECL